MTALYRIRAAWTGFPGAPGVSTFYGLTSGTSLADLRAFFLSMAPSLPADVTIQVENTGDIIEDTTGALTGAWTDDPVLPVTGSAPPPYAAPVGVMLKWATDTIVDGHRLRGRTFLVPCAGGVFDDDGSINDADFTLFNGYATVLGAAVIGNIVVWHRPRVARAADGSRPAVTARAGSHGLITACSVPDEAVVLRSRRD